MILGIIQARTGSHRLPGKIFLELSGKPNLYHVYNRVKMSAFIDNIIIATTNEDTDDRVFEFCSKKKINCFRGSESDVLDRFYQCCLQWGVSEYDTVVRITADCPLIDPVIIDEVIQYYENYKYDYVSNAIEPTYPDGLDVEVFSFFALKKSWENATLVSEREHVTPFIRKHSELFKIGSYKNKVNLSHLRWTLDEIEDYQLITEIYKNLYSTEKVFLTEEVLAFLRDNPNLNAINSKFSRNEGYLKSIEKDFEMNKGVIDG